MATSGKQLQPIIVKRVKKAGHAAHGGAWKIAYADFVTAMMAFFLLMWLLGSTTKGDLQGIAEYFQSPLKVAMQGGNGSGNSDSILPGGGRDLSKASGQVDGGDSQRKFKAVGAQLARAEQQRRDQMRIELLKDKIDAVISNSPKLKEFKSQIRLEKVNDGLNIQIVDDQNRPMFDSGSALVKPYMRDILTEVGAALKDVDNQISISGHTDSTSYGNGDRGYSNWELSADRANASRRELVAAGLPDGKLVRVEGLSSSSPLDAEKPNAPINRRISILVMTHEAVERMHQSLEGAKDAAAEGGVDLVPSSGGGVAPSPVAGRIPVSPPAVVAPARVR